MYTRQASIGDIRLLRNTMLVTHHTHSLSIITCSAVFAATSIVCSQGKELRFALACQTLRV